MTVFPDQVLASGFLPPQLSDCKLLLLLLLRSTLIHSLILVIEVNGEEQTLTLLVGFDQLVGAQRRGLKQDQGIFCEGIVKGPPDARTLQAQRSDPQRA